MINLRSVGRVLASILFASFMTFIALAQEAPREGRQDVSFRKTEFKDVLNELGAALKLNVVFDDQVKSGDKVDIDLHDVTIEQAMKIILIQKRYQARVIEENTVIVFPDNQVNRSRFGQYKPWPAKKVEEK